MMGVGAIRQAGSGRFGMSVAWSYMKSVLCRNFTHGLCRACCGHSTRPNLASSSSGCDYQRWGAQTGGKATRFY